MSLRLAIGAAALVAMLVLPAIGNDYVLALASRIVIFAVLAVSLDLILGYGGMISFGHAAYFGAGAYVVGALTLGGIHNGLVHLALAIAGPALLALAVGALSVRTRSIYFIMLTFAFAQMLFYLAIGQQQFGGDDGMPLAKRSQLWLLDLANVTHFYYFALAVLALVLFVCDRLVRSRFGMVLQGCKQNEIRLQTIGVPTYGYKVAAFGIAGAIAGLAGFLVANLNAYVSPNFLDWKVSGDVIMMIVIGGIGTLFGAPIGAAIFLLLQEVISYYTQHWMAVFGPLLVLAALFWKRGVYGLVFRRP
jgi:branched-chain amino acid transport system permease protein